MQKLKFWYYRLLWHIAPYTKHGILTHIDIELNNNCNQKCISCWHSQKEKPFVIHSINNIKTITNILKAFNGESVKFNLRGEPLLSPILIDCIKAAKKLGYIDIMINTNGILLDYDMIRTLNESGITTVIISVDSFNVDIYKKTHGATKREFETLMHNLSVLRKFYEFDSISFKTKLNFHMNIYNENENFFDKGDYFFKYMEPVFRNTMNRHGKDITVHTIKRKRKKVCPHMMRRLTVTSNYNLYPCCVCYDEPSDILLKTDEDRIKLIDNYKKGIYTETCKNCTSEDIWK